MYIFRVEDSQCKNGNKKLQQEEVRQRMSSARLSKLINQFSMKEKNHSRSPRKMVNSVNLSQRSHLKSRADTSPRKQPNYSVLHQNKLKVFIKFKPPTASNSKLLNVAYLTPNEVEIQRQTANNKAYTFDRVYHHSVGSQEVFSSGCKDVLDGCLSPDEDSSSKNGLIFVYGHTGTGKTHTMGLIQNIGKGSQGIVPQSLRYIFRNPKVAKVGLSFTQIYMDEVYDLLDFENDRKMTIRQHQLTKQPYVENQIMINISSIEQAYQLINIGLEKRRIAQQKMNKRSSRGHGLLTISIITHPNQKESRLCFVDLAGSERIKQSESSGKTLTEAVHINTSLSALQTLLMNIGQQSVRMYRGNKLTRLLQPYLEAGKIRLFVTSNYENIQPIQFAKRCKGIRFMEREIVEEKSPCAPKQSNKSKNQIQKIESLQALNKNLLYCISNTLGLMNKIKQTITTSLQDQSIQSNFSLSDTFSIKNEELENRVNTKIQKLEAVEQQIMDREMPSSIGGSALEASGLSQFSLGEGCDLARNSASLISTIKANPNLFMKKVHEMGFHIFQSIKQLSTLSEYRNIYKKEVFSSELKACLLENKNNQFEEAINHLLTSFKKQAASNPSQLSKVIKQLGSFGINVEDGKKQQKSKPRKSINSHTTASSQHKNNGSTSSSKVKKEIIQNHRRNSEITPQKSSREQYNQFLPFSTEHPFGEDPAQLFQPENTNSINQGKGSQQKGEKRSSQPPKNQKKPNNKLSGLDLLNQKHKRSLILIEDL